MFSVFRKKQQPERTSYSTDIHSHLLPGLDDGVESFDESLEILSKFAKLGYKKVITTPHIMSDFYKNTPSGINNKLEKLRELLKEKEVDIEVEAAAEYYLDEHLLQLMEDPSSLMTFGDGYILFETAFLNRPPQLHEFIFLAKSNNLKPVLAHPERYAYLEGKLDEVTDLMERGALMQINVNSISGHYSKPIRNMAQKMIDAGFVHFLGSDCHNLNHINLFQKSASLKYFQKALNLPLINYSL